MVSPLLGQVCNGESNLTVNQVSYDKVSATLTLPTRKEEHMFKFMILIFILYSYISFYHEWNTFILAQIGQ